MSACWEQRGSCDEEMRSRCPHALQSTYHPCPTDCNFSTCTRPQHQLVSGLKMLDYPNANFSTVMKEGCRNCLFFLENGPQL